MHGDVLTIGNAMVDILLSIPTSEKRCHFDTTSGMLSIRAGEKIAANKASVTAGGGAVRVAIALKRLGYKTAIAADIGEDEFGDKILAALKGEHVDTTHVVRSAKETSASIGINYQQERTLFTHHVTYPHKLTFPATPPKFLYLAALGEQWTDAYASVADFCAKNPSVHLAFNPGHTQLEAGVNKIKPILQETDIIFLNKEEAMLLTTPAEDMQTFLTSVQALGPKTVVITDGKKGSYLLDNEGNAYHIGILPATVREKTGAGDAFAAGFLAGILEGKDTVECLSWGTCSSASVIGQLGGHAGLLTKGELRSLLERGDMPKVKNLRI